MEAIALFGIALAIRFSFGNVPGGGLYLTFYPALLIATVFGVERGGFCPGTVIGSRIVLFRAAQHDGVHRGSGDRWGLKHRNYRCIESASTATC